MMIGRRCFSSLKHQKVSLPEGIKHHKIVNYRSNAASNDQTKKKLAVVIGWLGAKDYQLKSYLSFYHHHGFDTLSFAIGPRHIIAPDEAIKHMENVWDTAFEHSPDADIVVHAFSVGGYLYGQSLRCIQKSPERYGILKSRIRAQVFDSPPDHGSIAHGLSKSFNLPIPLEKPVEMLFQGYLTLTHNTTGVEHRAASQIFHNNFIQSPSLFFYSLSDPISRYQDCEQVINTWRSNGIPVDTCRWEKSPHIQHGRVDPERYFGELEKLLERSDLLEKKKKNSRTQTPSSAILVTEQSPESAISQSAKVTTLSAEPSQGSAGDQVEYRTNFKMLVANRIAGAIIGQNGLTLVGLQEKCGAKIRISSSDDYYPGTSERVILITGLMTCIVLQSLIHLSKGKEKNVHHAQQLIWQTIAQVLSLLCSSFSHHLSSFSSITTSRVMIQL
jgi:hypothetical protein